jgi:hypothetical protein
VLSSRFPAIDVYAERPLSDFVARFLVRERDGKVTPVTMLRPRYYETMVSRLYLFHGKGYEPQSSTWLVASKPVSEPAREESEGFGPGQTRFATDIRRMATWAEAEAFLARPEGAGYEVMGRDPLKSCVPLEPLTTLRKVYPEAEDESAPAFAQEVRIFERTAAAAPGQSS